MGNCQAIDSSTLVIQHPGGRIDSFYWPVTASDIMRMNPGHHVAFLLPTTTTTAAAGGGGKKNNNNKVRVTRIKVLRPTDTLVLGHVYRLITTQDVMRGLWEKKCAKMKKKQLESSDEKKEMAKEKPSLDFYRAATDNTKQVTKHERQKPKVTATTAKSRTGWQPSLRSISEAA